MRTRRTDGFYLVQRLGTRGTNRVMAEASSTWLSPIAGHVKWGADWFNPQI